MENDIAIEFNEYSVYPNGKYSYSPNIYYPEYPYSKETLAPQKNDVYDMVRNTFRLMGLDKENYGTKAWNPLGDIIQKGDTVLVKPNWVMHLNAAEQNTENLECLVTHPSVVRAVVDYIHIALGQSGKVYVADAPMQECDLEKLFTRAGYRPLFDFWKLSGINLEIRDLRHYASTIENNVLKEIKDNDSNEAVSVDLGIKSVHHDGGHASKKYKVSQYLMEDTQKYHNNIKHEYILNKIVLDADVIINIPKPKCHRLAGMTAAMKNMVGTVYDKNCLPHRRLGSPKEGGDAYAKSSVYKRIMEITDEKKTKASFLKHYKIAKVFSVAEKIAYLFGVLTTGDKSRVGGWYGNDTIWRTIVDINTIVDYCDKNGAIQENKQRKTFVIGDMIICGQKNGPVKPSPKYLGMIMAATDFLSFDYTMSKIMGFDFENIKYIKFKINESDWSSKDIKILSNLSEISGYLSDFIGQDEWKFEPHVQWKGHV